MTSAASSSSYLSVLRIGPTVDNASATLLKDAILDYYFQKSTPSESTATLPEKKPQFHVENRYFRAQLLLQSMEESNDNTSNTNNNNDEDASSSVMRKEDCMILVFDNGAATSNNPLSLGSSFDSLNAVHDKALAEGKDGDLLRLVVGVSMNSNNHSQNSTGKEYEQEYSRRILWCLDRGYEYVEADLSSEGLARGHEDRDKEGFARIIEAIGGTVWSSAVMAKKKSAQLMATYQADKSEQEVKQEDSKENPYVPPDPSLLETAQSSTGDDETKLDTTNPLTDDERAEKAKEALLQEDDHSAEDSEDPNPYLPSDTSKTTLPSKEEIAKEREQERMFDQLDSALRQAASIREMSQSGTLSDQERRQRAGDAATLLMNLMNQIGMDEDDDDEEEENSLASDHGDDRDDPPTSTETPVATSASA